jgi:acylphosphatase
MTIAKRVQYSGRVQGVGFRYAAQEEASTFPVAGYVRNLPNGDVELLAEGPPAVVEGFLGALARRMAGYIELTTVAEEAPAGLQGFRIRY